MAEYASLDQNDESLNRWKASLGISSSPPIAVDPNDQRRCVIKSLALEVQGRPDFTYDLTAPGSLESLKGKPFSIKEGAKFRMKAHFVVQHDVLSGLKYIQVVKRKGIRVAKNEEMIVSPTCHLIGQHSLVRRDRTHPIPRRSHYTRRNVSFPSHTFGSTQSIANTVLVEEDEAPSGMLARGHYEAASRFTDDDGKEYLKFDWSFDIGKDWK